MRLVGDGEKGPFPGMERICVQGGDYAPASVCHNQADAPYQDPQKADHRGKNFEVFREVLLGDQSVKKIL